MCLLQILISLSILHRFDFITLKRRGTVTKLSESALWPSDQALCVTHDLNDRFITSSELRKYIYSAHGSEKLWPWELVLFWFFFFFFFGDQKWVWIGLYIKSENKVWKVSTHCIETCTEPKPSRELRWKGEEKIGEAGQLKTSGRCCWSLSASWQWTLPWLHGVWTSLSFGPCCLC